MTYHALLEFIRKAKECGANDADIAQRLHGAGWYKVDVQDAMELYHRITRPKDTAACEPSPVTPRPSVAERIAPRSYDPHLIAVAAVSFAVGFVLYVLLTR
jgi:hypothetical protein